MSGKLMAILFLAAIALTPIGIIALWHRTGAIWVTGYVFGIITVPLIGIGAMRAINALFDDTEAFLYFVAFGVTAIAVSLIAATCAFSL